jgi:hypothetical protein
LHLKARIDDIISDLTLIEENIKTHPKSNQDKTNKKQLKNPCRLHNGNHEWDECRQNPKNQKEDGKNKNDNNCSRGGNGNNGRMREEQRRTERDGRTPRNRSRSNSSRGSTEEEEIYVINNRRGKEKEVDNKLVPSSEILVAMPEQRGSKKYKTYLGLVD